MSRLIVKNLPKTVTDKRLREIFSEKGIVTDVQLKYTKDGKFRRFGFIGFKTEEEAKTAKEYFDKTCVDTAKISVEHCANLGDPLKPKSWSKYAADSSHNESSTKNYETELKQASKRAEFVEKSIVNVKEKKKDKNVGNEVRQAIERHKNDPLFMEFLSSHTFAKEISNVWKNDVDFSINNQIEETDKIKDNDYNAENELKKDDTKLKVEMNENKIANKTLTDLEYMEELKKRQENSSSEIKSDMPKVLGHGPCKFFTVKIQGLGYNHKKKHVKHFFQPLKPKSIRLPPKIKGIAFVGFETELQMRKALLKNKSFLEGKQLLITKYENKKEGSDTVRSELNNINIKWKAQEEALKEEESIAESGRIFIRNLSYSTTEDCVRNLFEKYGLLSEINLPIDKITRKPKGFGIVTFMMPEHAVRAYAELDGTTLNGRMLHLLQGKSKFSPSDLLEQGLTFKRKKDLKSKATSGSSHNWNSLFLGQNAVAEAVASTYNTTKEKVLEDGHNGLSAAVKLALGETQLVQETRNFLEENGVCLDAFNQPPEKRSKTVILVKNLPTNTTVGELRKLFIKFGELGRVVMPKSGITALVEFLEPSEARHAFTKLAYTQFKYLPLYLEWAPENAFVSSFKRIEKNSLNENTKINYIKSDEIRKKEINEEKVTNILNDESKDKESDEDDEPELDTTLFVKNINFSTTEEKLKEYFSKCGAIHYATIAMKKDTKIPGGKLSMGYGFVRYKYKSDAERALRTLQMTVLDDKTLELKRSERILETDLNISKKIAKVMPQTGTKILVRNVPFQATAEEIKHLFKAFGELKAVRLPKKLVGVEKHKGFAFVEYYTKNEAKRAFKALCQSTHLYGRRLVLEWAQTEEGIDEIRKRTAKHFQQDISEPKRSKRGILDPESVGLDIE
ncbi:probable RNA-binding protein 19 isoform X2 [Prorops nasuta]|uniref:probable RNA-binding protein 19 isoform X2 n=1 Tax=Prorops nasuta TaxID=863751 RepID=UPI0034CEBB67